MVYEGSRQEPRVRAMWATLRGCSGVLAGGQLAFPGEMVQERKRFKEEQIIAEIDPNFSNHILPLLLRPIC